MFVTRCRLACVAVLVAAGVCGAEAAAQTDLRYKFKEGDKLNYLLEQKMTMDMNVAGQDVKMEIKQVMDLTWKVGSVDKDGKARITQTITRLQLVMDGPTGKIEYDSKDGKVPDDPIGGAMASVFKALVGSDVSMVMDSRGRMSDIKLSDKYKEAIKANPAGAMLGDLLSEDGMKRMMSQSGLVLPDSPAGKGKSWNSKVEGKMGAFGKMIVDFQYGYEGPETRGGKKLEKISVKPTVTILVEDDAPVSMKIASQDNKGTAYFDNEAGRLVEMTMTQNVEMAVTAMGQTFTQKIKSTTTMKPADGK